MVTEFRISRRGMLTTAAAGIAAMAVPTSAAAATGKPITLRLPEPAGRFAVGTVDLHLVDRSRADPLRPERSFRELMVSAFYPAACAPFFSRAPHMPPKAAAQWDLDIPGLGLPSGVVDWAATTTHAHSGAPVAQSRQGYPVVLYSPGMYMPRTMGTVLVTELASRGYVVVTVDHTYEAMEVEFPGGRLERVRRSDADPMSLVRKYLQVRVADLRFVADRLHAFDGFLPRGLRRGLDPSRLGVFGHSLGGASAAQAMHDDNRFAAGIDLDGWLQAPQGPLGTVTEEGLDRPFLVMDSEAGDHHHPGLAPFWDNLRGWRLNLQLRNSQHNSYCDFQVLLPQLAARAQQPDAATLAALIGSIDPLRSVRAQSAYIAAFFDSMLKERDEPLLDGPSARYPQMRFVA